MSNSKKRTVSEHAKRISLRCPCAIVSSALDQDKADGSYSIRITLENTGDEGVENDTVSSASIVIRCTDTDGQGLSFNGSECLLKTVSFGEDGLEKGQEISMTVILGIFEGVKLSDFEVYISRIRFGDGTVMDYLRADFFPLPAKPIPLTKRLNASELEKAKETFGEGAEFLPERLSSAVWRCTCSEICEGPVCTMCGSLRDDLFDFFGIGSSVYLPKKEQRNKKKSKSPEQMRKLLILALLVLIVITLGAMLIVAIASKGADQGGEKDNTTTTTTTKDPGTVDDPSYNDYEKLAMGYANAGQFENALKVVDMGGCSDEFRESIILMAIDHYSTKGDFVKSYGYSQMLSSYDKAPELISNAYTQCMNGKNYKEAVFYANLLNNAALKLDAVEKLVEELLGKNDYISAYQTAAENSEFALAEDIFDRGLVAYLEADDYDNAIELSRLTGDTELTLTLYTDAVNHYLSLNDYDGAAKYAAGAGDRSVMEYLCEKLDNSTVRANLPSYYEFLSESRRRAVLASRLGTGRSAAFVTDDGEVLYGTGLIYTPVSPLKAVSVASGDLHTVILLSNGSVVALGDNSYGQCDLPEINNAVMVAAGKNHTVVLTADGRLIAVGDNTYGQCSLPEVSSPVFVCAGDEFTVILGEDGRLTACGNNSSGQCLVSSFENVVSVSAGKIHCVALTSNGKALAAGSTLLGMSGVESWSNLVSLQAGGTFTLGLTASGEYLLTGNLITGSVGDIYSLAGAPEYRTDDGYILALLPDGRVISTGALAPDVSWINEYVEQKKAELPPADEEEGGENLPDGSDPEGSDPEGSDPDGSDPEGNVPENNESQTPQTP